MPVALDPVGRRAELLAFRASYLEEKLCTNRVVASPVEAAAYFDEVKKYLLLTDRISSHRLPMISRMVDEVWHQFVLFTLEYEAFSVRFFGRYMHHCPGGAPLAEGGADAVEATPAQFVAFYESEFGPLPLLWDDSATLMLTSRVVRDTPHHLALRFAANAVELVVSEPEPRVVSRVNAWYEPALRFISETDMFLVRELDDRLLDEDKVRLVALLLRRGVVRRAP